MMNDSGYLIDDYLTKETWSIGSPGVQIFKMEFTKGSLLPIAESPDKFNLRVNYDCPFRFWLEDGHKGEFEYKNRQILYFHIVKRRGQQEFSTLDILRLPQFSSIQIAVPLSKDDFVVKDNVVISNELGDLSWELINFLNQKINDVIEKKKYKVDLNANKVLSYRNLYFRNQDINNPVAYTVFPYTSLIHIDAPPNTETIDEDVLRLYLKNKVKLKDFIDEYLPKVELSNDFEKIVFRIVHDFAYYCSERPESLNSLNEELIRDLFLITLKTLLPYSEAEVFNYDGKLDFKVHNPLKDYEAIIGEFKIWSGQKSFNECMQQITEKHSTGGEKEVYILFINKNKKVKQTYEKILDMLKADSHYLKEIDRSISLSRSQLFSKHLLQIKGHEIPATLGIINVFYEKV